MQVCGLKLIIRSAVGHLRGHSTSVLAPRSPWDSKLRTVAQTGALTSNGGKDTNDVEDACPCLDGRGAAHGRFALRGDAVSAIHGSVVDDRPSGRRMRP